MIPYTLNYTIEAILKNNRFDERKTLKNLTGKSFSRTEAAKIWTKVQDHKWFVSEKLGRDVGFRVAAVDFVENIYQPNVSGNKNRHGGLSRLLRPMISAA